ncbi:MAG TPA: hypothetical protein VKB67_00145 [Rhizomicrobium sp.]|nr:hypothetical protein [Rhizomicrobium sp.]
MKQKIPDKTYLVRWDPGRAKFIALDEDGNLLGTDVSRNRTIGSACREAVRASKDGVRVIVMFEDENGRRTKACVVRAPGDTGSLKLTRA